jgi:hypothetical protein
LACVQVAVNREVLGDAVVVVQVLVEVEVLAAVTASPIERIILPRFLLAAEDKHGAAVVFHRLQRLQ